MDRPACLELEGSRVTVMDAVHTGGVKRELGIPAGVSAIAPIIIGTPADVGLPTTRKEPHVLNWLVSR